MEFLSRNEGRWRAGIQSALVGGDQELEFKEGPAGSSSKRNTERRYRKTPRGNGLQLGPLTADL